VDGQQVLQELLSEVQMDQAEDHPDLQELFAPNYRKQEINQLQVCPVLPLAQKHINVSGQLDLAVDPMDPVQKAPLWSFCGERMCPLQPCMIS
ncbi:MAG: hypothetical protein ACRC6N_06530, partial [Plesiomonas sp.]|uniref:hypothetical protein n=1 Tax=Plesiomonas sp. TaxID=2486279 RepID=UPI003F313078